MIVATSKGRRQQDIPERRLPQRCELIAVDDRPSDHPPNEAAESRFDGHHAMSATTPPRLLGRSFISKSLTNGNRFIVKAVQQLRCKSSADEYGR